jgi:Mg/Co/Ni transporter MgtE
VVAPLCSAECGGGREARVGLLLGVLFAMLGFPIVLATWSVEIAATASLTLLAVCAWATTIGALPALISSRLGIDPAVVSAPLWSRRSSTRPDFWSTSASRKVIVL